MPDAPVSGGSPDPPAPWHTLEADEIARLLGTSPDGLSPDEVARRLAEYGPNDIERERETPLWKIVLRQFADPLIYILLIAALLTLVLQDYEDTGVILLAVLMNAAIGVPQERKAQRAMRALQDLSAPHSEVVRGGAVREVASSDLVPGDVVVLASGARVPADVRLFRVQELHVDESALTGESIAAHKSVDSLRGQARVPGDQFNMAFSGTVVTRGRGWGYVVRTGGRTELGRIAMAIRSVGSTTTPLQEKMKAFGHQIAVVILLLAVLVGAIGLLRGMPLSEMVMVTIALIVSAIPESLPVILTVTFAVGVRRMARRNAIVRALPAVETLGSATVIGSDKTGTLTRNEMTVERVWTGGSIFTISGAGYNAAGEITAEGADRPLEGELDHPLRTTLLAAVLSNEADPGFLDGGDPVGDPTELALHAAAAKGGLAPGALRSEYRQLDIVPFESEQRFMATLNEVPEGRTIYMKGAPEVVLAACDRQLTREGEEHPIDRDTTRQAASELAGHGLRVLATAYQLDPAGDERIVEDELKGGFVLAGLLGMGDPIRAEAAAAVRDAESAGIRVIMLTGDHVETASSVGRTLGLDAAGAGALEGAKLDGLSPEQLDPIVRKVNIYARVAPEHKLRIVERLKAQGEVVAVTGDGVNDAPALRAAHLGIAMGKSGTDVAREASDVVLADDNFASITAAVEEGRVVFANVRKVIFFLLSTTTGDILSILVAILLGWPVPFTAAQILWVNLVTNGLQDLALAVEPPERGLLKRPPRSRHEGVITRRHLMRFLAVGAILATGALSMFWWTLQQTGNLDLARSAAMTQIVVFNFFHVLNSRSLDQSITKIPFFSNRLLFYTVVGAGAAQMAVLYLPPLQRVFSTVPIPLEMWGMMLLIGSTVIVGGELDKWWNRRRGVLLG